MANEEIRKMTLQALKKEELIDLLLGKKGYRYDKLPSFTPGPRATDYD